MSEYIRDRVWLTAHVRMRTEARLRRQSRFLNFLIFWFSTALTCLTVYQLTAVKSPVRDMTSAALAIVVLALSIFVPSLNLDQQADKFRECYLKLQRLLDYTKDNDILLSSYYDVLEAYPNHPANDYIDFVVISKFNNQTLTSSEKTILPTKTMCASHWLRRIASFLAAAAAMLAPGLLYFLL